VGFDFVDCPGFRTGVTVWPRTNQAAPNAKIPTDSSISNGWNDPILLWIPRPLIGAKAKQATMMHPQLM
jgi:hypothetical protein